MNNLNKIFGIVQDHCHDYSAIDGHQKLKEIASEVGVTLERLHFYLECLHETGLVHYEKDGKKVSLTKKGEKAKYVFQSDR